MKGAVLHGSRDVRFKQRDAPEILKPTDAILRISATCICGSDLWPCRGISAIRAAHSHSVGPGKVFDLALPLDQVIEGYRAMDERRAIKTLLWP